MPTPLPMWATVLVIGVITATGGYMVRYLVASSRTLGKIEGMLSANSRRINRVEDWQDAHDAEVVARANGYRERARRR